MAIARPVFPDRSYFMTRRTSQRQFLLRPDDETAQALLYCLAEAAALYGIELLFTMIHSNHHHTGIYDRHARYPEFIERFHRHVAKVQNARFGRWESFWSPEQTCMVQMVEPSDIFGKMVYSLTNPVKDHLVERAHHWPGASSLRQNLTGETIEVARPRTFFDPNGDMPERVTLNFVRPRGFEHLTQEQFADTLRAGIAEAEEEAAAERRRTGRTILGRKAVRAQSWRDRPESAEPRREMKPRVAARSKWARIETLQRLRSFTDAYAKALRDFNEDRDAEFPAGTYWMRRFLAVRCGPAPND